MWNPFKKKTPESKLAITVRLDYPICSCNVGLEWGMWADMNMTAWIAVKCPSCGAKEYASQSTLKGRVEIQEKSFPSNVVPLFPRKD